MAEKFDKLFDIEETDIDNQGAANGSAVSDTPVLIEKRKSASAEEIKAERLSALRNVETYRQRQRMERDARRGVGQNTEAEAELKLQREKALETERERERELARENSDRVRELLSRIEGMNTVPNEGEATEGECAVVDEVFKKAAAEEAAPEPCEDFIPLKRSESAQDTDVPDVEAAEENVITVDVDMQSNFLHIEGMDLGEVVHGTTVVTDGNGGVKSYVTSHPAGVPYPDPEAVVDPELIIPRGRRAQKEGTMPDARDYERELISKNAGNTMRGAYTDDEDTADLYLNGEFDVNSTYPEPSGGGLIKRRSAIGSDYDRETDISRQRTATGKAYPDLDTSDQYIDSDFDVNSTYPEAGREYIARGGKVRPTAYDRAVDLAMLDTAKRVAYPDPEAPASAEPELAIVDTFGEPMPDVPKQSVKLSRRERRENARAMRDIERDDMMRFERESRGTAPFPVADLGDALPVGEDIPGTIYPDPDYVTDEPVLYGTPTGEVSRQMERAALERYNDLYGDEPERVKASKSNDTPVFDKRALKKKVKQSRALDILAVEERYESALRELRLELQSAELRFDRKKDTGERTAREIQKEIAKTEKKMARAIREAELDNDRFFAPVLTDYTVAKLKKGANREALLEKRVALLDELARRDEINEKLIALYTGKEDGKRAHFEGRVMAEMKAKRRAYRRQRGLDRAIVKYHISHSFSKRLYALMDEYVMLSGEIARLEYSLKREKLLRSVKRDMKKECKKLKRKLLRVSDHIDYYEKRAIEEADDRREVKRKMIIGWSVLIGLCALGLLAWAFWEPLVAYIAEVYGGGV